MPSLSPDRDRATKSEVLSRRRLLGRAAAVATLGALGPTLTGCGPRLPRPSDVFQRLAGSAQQATGAAPPPKQLRWVTPIPPRSDTSGTIQDESTRGRFEGWWRMLDLWKKAHPSITLVHHVVGEADLTRTTLELARSGGPADVAYTDWGATLGQAGIVDPLDVGPLARKIVPVAFTPHGDGNQIYALPVFLTCLGLYVGHARLQEADLDPAMPLRSWSSFETVARKLTDRSHQRYGFDVFGNGSPRSGQMRYAPFLWSAGGNFFDGAGSKATWNLAPGLDAIIYLARLSQNYATPGSAVASDDKLVQGWFDRSTAFLLAGPELVARADAQKVAYSIQSVPAYIQGQASSLAMSAGASALFAISKHKDWGLDFVRYLADKDAQVAGLTSAPLLPANSEAGDDAPVFRSNPSLAEFLRILREDDVHAFPMARAHNPEIQQIFQTYLGVALRGLMTPRSAWNASADAATALLQSPTPTARPSG